MSDASLIKLFTDKDIYNNYKKYIKTKLLGDVHKEFLESFSTYFGKFEHDKVDAEQFLLWFVQSYKSDCDDSVVALYATAWDNIKKADTGVVQDLLLKFNEEAIKDALQEHIELEKFDTDKIMNLCKKHEDMKLSLVGSKYDKYKFEMDLAKAIEATDRSNGLQWRLNCLNNSLGHLVRGDLIFVFGYVDTGKTKFLISEITHMAQQLTEGKVLYLNNEESNEKLLKDLHCATLRRTLDAVEANGDLAKEHYKRLMHGDENRIQLFKAEELGVGDFAAMAEVYKPKLMVVDLVNNIAKQGDNRYDVAVGDVGFALRQIAKNHCPVIAFMQADQSSTYWDKEENKKRPLRWLSFSQLADSKVQLPGKADAIIGIGRDELMPNSRFIKVSKNKMCRSKNPFDINLQKEVYFDGGRCLYLDEKD